MEIMETLKKIVPHCLEWEHYEYFNFFLPLFFFRVGTVLILKLFWSQFTFRLTLRNFWVGTVKKPPCIFSFQHSEWCTCACHFWSWYSLANFSSLLTMSARLALRKTCTVKSWRHLLNLFYLEYYFGLHCLLGSDFPVLCQLLPLQAVCLPQPFWLLKIIQMTKNRRRQPWSENWIAKQVRLFRRHNQGHPCHNLDSLKDWCWHMTYLVRRRYLEWQQ